MGDNRKFILMIQPVGRQGALWQAILRSQHFSVIWESTDVNLPDSFRRLKLAGAQLPDLLLIDTRLQSINPYAICRWCQTHYPTVKVVLINGAQTHIIAPEREWAILQGAADLLPRFQSDMLMSGAAANARRILDILGCETLDSGSLVAALLRTSQTHQPAPRVNAAVATRQV